MQIDNINSKTNYNFIAQVNKFLDNEILFCQINKIFFFISYDTYEKLEISIN